MNFSAGFQLIELLIVISLISLLSAVGFSNYSNYLAHTYRLEAEQLLLKGAVIVEQYQLEHPDEPMPTQEKLNLPTHIAHDKYSLEIQWQAAAYSLTATPLNNQKELDINCGALTLRSTGEKTISGNGKADECW